MRMMLHAMTAIIVIVIVVASVVVIHSSACPDSHILRLYHQQDAKSSLPVVLYTHIWSSESVTPSVDAKLCMKLKSRQLH